MNALRELAATWAPKAFGNALSPAGVCFAGDRLSAAQLQRTPDGPMLHAIASLELGRPWNALLAEPRRFGQMLKRFWSEHGFDHRDVVAAMPQEQLKVFTMDYSAAPGQTDADAIATELKDRLKGKTAGLVVDFVPVRQNDGERSKQAVVATASRDDVAAFLDLLEHAGLRVQALDISSMALRRIVTWTNKTSASDQRSALVIDIGWTSSELMIVSGRRLMLDRSIEFGEQRLVSRVARLLELPEVAAKRLIAEHAFRAGPSSQAAEFDAALREMLGAELVALRSEVIKTLDYAASKTRGIGVDKVLVVGAVAAFPGIAQFLGGAFGKPVESLDPLAFFPHRLMPDEAARLSAHCGAAVAIGLALRGVPHE